MKNKNFRRNRRKSGKSCPGQFFVLEARIVEKVGQDNFFHHFYDSKDFLKTSWKKWKKLAWPTFSTMQAILEAQIVEKVGQDNFFHHFYDSKRLPQIFLEKVEKLGLANMFHDLGFQNGLSRGKCWPGQLFPPFLSFIKLSQKFVEKVEKVGLATFLSLESWKMLVRLTFATVFVIYKTSSEIAGKLAGSRFSRVIDGNG